MARRAVAAAVLFVVLAARLPRNDAKKLEGVTGSADCFHFLGRFAFIPYDPANQDIQYQIMSPKVYEDLKLIFYYDTTFSWQKASVAPCRS